MKLVTMDFTNYVEFEENLYITVLNNELYYEENHNYSKPRKVTNFKRNVLLILQR